MEAINDGGYGLVVRCHLEIFTSSCIVEVNGLSRISCSLFHSRPYNSQPSLGAEILCRELR